MTLASLAYIREQSLAFIALGTKEELLATANITPTQERLIRSGVEFENHFLDTKNDIAKPHDAMIINMGNPNYTIVPKEPVIQAPRQMALDNMMEVSV